MSDQPLFQNTDEQEQAYVSENLPAGDAEAGRPADELGGRDADEVGATVPVAGLALGSGAVSSPATGGIPASGAAGAETAAAGDIAEEARGARAAE